MSGHGLKSEMSVSNIISLMACVAAQMVDCHLVTRLIFAAAAKIDCPLIFNIPVDAVESVGGKDVCTRKEEANEKMTLVPSEVAFFLLPLVVLVRPLLRYT